MKAVRLAEKRPASKVPIQHRYDSNRTLTNISIPSMSLLQLSTRDLSYFSASETYTAQSFDAAASSLGSWTTKLWCQLGIQTLISVTWMPFSKSAVATLSISD